MTVIFLEKSMSSTRGLLKRWFIEPRPGVYVGTVNVKTREKVLAYLRRHDRHANFLVVFDNYNAQGFSIQSIGSPKRNKITRSGLQLICENPSEEPAGEETAESEVPLPPIGQRTLFIEQNYDSAMFVDIETDGLQPGSKITCVSCSIGDRMSTFMQGQFGQFLEMLRNASLIVSFNGRQFDIPRIKSQLGAEKIPPHVDLMEEARPFGLVGRLKTIEKDIGFERAECECRDGRDAVRCWEKNTKSSIDALVRYNREDVRSMIHLYREILRRLKENL